jgi:hypothetical protein
MSDIENNENCDIDLVKNAKAAEAVVDKNLIKTKRKEALDLVNFRKAAKKKECRSPRRSAGGSGGKKKKKCICPVCLITNLVGDKIAGRNFFTIPFTNFKLPRFDHLKELIPTFDQNRRPGEKCGACEGTKQITDHSDDTAKYQEVAQKIEQNSEKIMQREAQLGLGGTRTTIIQGSDLLFVGLGFNGNKTHETIPEGALAPTMKGGKIPQQNATKINEVVGKQTSLAWPQSVGNYSIKCANKFSLLAGAGGITFATPGPLTFSSGILKFVGPQISIGCATGPLALEGESVNITGKAISVSPTGGELFVKGSINNTGNTTVQGHAHAESMSFVRASCIGTTKSTYSTKANPDVTCTQTATWSTKAIAAAALDLKYYMQGIPTDSKTSAFRLMSPAEGQAVSDRMASMGSLAQPWESKTTGYILPGTAIKINAAQCPCNYYGPASGVITGTVIAPVNINNFPHIHGIPEMVHKHEIQLPDMDYTSDSPAALRSKVITGAHESGAPADPTKDTTTRTAEAKRTVGELSANVKAEATRVRARFTRFR